MILLFLVAFVCFVVMFGSMHTLYLRWLHHDRAHDLDDSNRLKPIQERGFYWRCYYPPETGWFWSFLMRNGSYDSEETTRLKKIVRLSMVLVAVSWTCLFVFVR
jgi:hypothetical protein